MLSGKLRKEVQVPDDELAKKLHQEIKPEMDRMWADHKRTMDLIFDSATDEQKREMLAHLRKRALGPPKRAFPFVGVAVLVVAVILTVVIFRLAALKFQTETLPNSW
jgi:hypothetical protein